MVTVRLRTVVDQAYFLAVSVLVVNPFVTSGLSLAGRRSSRDPSNVLPSRYEPGAAASQGGLRHRGDGQRDQGGVDARARPAGADRATATHRANPGRPPVRTRPARRAPDRAG